MYFFFNQLSEFTESLEAVVKVLDNVECKKNELALFDLSIMCKRINDMIKEEEEKKMMTKKATSEGEYVYRAILFYERPDATVVVSKHPEAYAETSEKKNVVLDLFYMYTKYTKSLTRNAERGEAVKKAFLKVGFDYLIVVHSPDIAFHGMMSLLPHPKIRAPFGTFKSFIVIK